MFEPDENDKVHPGLMLNMSNTIGLKENNPSLYAMIATMVKMRPNSRLVTMIDFEEFVDHITGYYDTVS